MNCRACGSDPLITIFEMDPMPLAGAFAITRDAALSATKYPIEWRWCEYCGLVNVFPDIPDADIYADYSYRASDVPALVEHHRRFAGWLTGMFPNTKRFLEIGGNDGVLLRQLPKYWTKVNVDPSDVAGSVKDDWFTWVESWPTKVAGEYDLITSSNAFAHFSAIDEGLTAVREALTPDGRFVVEVHDLDATLASGQWDTVYSEHKVEWSQASLMAAGDIHGLELIHLERLPLHGGMLRAVFRKAAPRAPSASHKPSLKRLRDRYAERRPIGATVAYGAAARATVYLNQVHEPLEYIVDGSPRRYGRYVPGTGTPIVPPSAFGSPPVTLITAWTQADDIKARHPNYRGKWVTAW
jgi:SAM-dependent methyltransferase